MELTGASRFAQRQIEHHRRLAPAADLYLRQATYTYASRRQQSSHRLPRLLRREVRRLFACSAIYFTQLPAHRPERVSYRRRSDAYWHCRRRGLLQHLASYSRRGSSRRHWLLGRFAASSSCRVVAAALAILRPSASAASEGLA